MEDPEPLERVAKGVPAAFATIVRKLMAKTPAERYQSPEELKADLLRWTDPARVKAILGSEAESARVFRPPPPELDEDDLRLLDEDAASGPMTSSLRDFGDAEPGVAPMHRPATPARAAVVVSGTPKRRPPEPGPSPASGPPADDSRWLIGFVIAAFLLGALVVALIALTR